MSNPRVLGQNRVMTALSRAVAGGRVSHAYLFYGPSGVGKRAAAIDLAAALVCEHPNAGVACGVCNACSRALRLSHPDIHYLLPIPNDASVDAIRERVERTAEIPYATVGFEKRPSLEAVTKASNKQVGYAVERINQELRREMSFRSVEGGYKVAILTDADRMRREAANAFLKLLEEPGKKTVLVLITDRPDRLLPTIRSRCQSLRFERLETPRIEEALVARIGVEPKAASTIARMADGSFGQAIDLASSEELLAMRSLVIEFLRTAYTMHGDQVIHLSDRLQRLGREPIKFYLQLMLGWLRDLMLYRTIADRSFVVNLDQIESIEKFSDNLPDASIERMVEYVDDAIDLVERNVNLRLLFIVLAQALASAMRGHPVEKLRISLSDEPLETGPVYSS